MTQTPGLTFDAGALMALERRQASIAAVLALATKRGRTITVPAAVVVEWWRGRTDRRDDILAMVDVEPLDDELAKLAGEAIAATAGATVVDAIVMASAAKRGDLVYTSDVPDLLRLRSFFPSVRVVHL
jgi:predicted nucleic acid-binding protein